MNLCNVDTDTFIINIKAKDVDKDIANDVKKRFDTSNYEMERPLMIVRWKDYDKICRTQNKNVFLLNI